MLRGDCAYYTIGALMVATGLWCIFDYDHNKEFKESYGIAPQTIQTSTMEMLFVVVRYTISILNCYVRGSCFEQHSQLGIKAMLGLAGLSDGVSQLIPTPPPPSTTQTSKPQQSRTLKLSTEGRVMQTPMRMMPHWVLGYGLNSFMIPSSLLGVWGQGAAHQGQHLQIISLRVHPPKEYMLGPKAPI